MTQVTITQGSTVTVQATGDTGVVIAPSAGGAYKLHHAGEDRLNISVFSVLLDSGEVRQYTFEALELAE